MTMLNVKLPHSLHSAVEILAAKDEISVNQFISSAVAEKIASFEAESYIKTRGERGSRENFLNVLDKVPE